MAATNEYKEFKQASDDLLVLQGRGFCLVCTTNTAPPLDTYRDATIHAKLAAAGANRFLKKTPDKLGLRYTAELKECKGQKPEAIQFMKAYNYVVRQLKYFEEKGIVVADLHSKMQQVVLMAITDSIYEPNDDIYTSLAVLTSAVNILHNRGIDILSIKA